MTDFDVPRYPHPIIAREGWPFVAGSLILAVVATGLGWGVIAVALWLLAVFVIQFFRDPARTPRSVRGSSRRRPMGALWWWARRSIRSRAPIV